MHHGKYSIYNDIYALNDNLYNALNCEEYHTIYYIVKRKG